MKTSRPGFSLIESMFALAVLSIVALGGIASLYQSAALNRLNGERTRAQNAVRTVADDLLGRRPRDVYAAYAGARRFSVPGLQAADDGPAGEILFPDVGGTLRENFVDAAMGMPRDLNGDGRISSDPVADCTILPVRIRVRWRRPDDRIAEFSTVLILAER